MKYRIEALAFTLLLTAAAAQSCKSETGGGTGAGGTGAGGTGAGGAGGTAGLAGGAGGGAGGGSAALQWYATCGDPVCGTHVDHGLAACDTQVAGEPCSAAGQQCDPGNACNSLLLCTTTDPTMGPGGCPKSRARFKHDIRYLPEAEVARVRDDLVTMRLATWRYNHEGAEAREHLGFIIDDNPESPSVDGTGDRVDLYGYTSMAVAAIQVQSKEIAAQRRQLDALRQEMDALRQEMRACRGEGAR